MTQRKAITPAMKVDCLLYRYDIWCSGCGQKLMPDAKIEWDHIHALVHGGPHKYENLRPLHAWCHKPKSAKDVSAKAKVDRILGLTCNKPKKQIPSRPFSASQQRLK